MRQTDKQTDRPTVSFFKLNLEMPLSRSKTNSNVCEIVGKSVDLPTAVLPTRRDVVKCFYLIFIQRKVSLGGKNPAAKDVATEVGLKLEELWNNASIPTTDSNNICNRIVLEHNKVQTLNKSYKRDKDTESGRAKIQIFNLELDKLFDLCPCKCEDYSFCHCSVRVPLLERDFLPDQRGPRLMRMEGLDVGTTRRLKKRIERKTAEVDREEKRRKLSMTSSNGCNTQHQLDAPESDNPCLDEDEEFESPRNIWKETSQCRMKMEQFARTCDKVGVSDVAGAHLASALFADLDKCRGEEDKMGIVCDGEKLSREREKVRKALRQEQLVPGMPVCGLYFDGRNDNTKVLSSDTEGKKHQLVQKEHHISLIREPESGYLSHVTPTEKGASGIASAIQSFLTEEDVDLSTLLCLGTDGENTNTGTV